MADELINDVTPNDSEALGVYLGDEDSQTDEQRQESTQEREAMSSAVPIFQDLLAWFDEMIAGADSVGTLKATASKYKTNADNAMIAHDIVVGMLETKKDELKARFDNFIQAEEDESEEESDG